MAEISITLAHKTFKISSLTIRQSRDLRIGDAALDLKEGPEFWSKLYALCISTIMVAIREQNPDVTEEELWKLPTSENELTAARRTILIFAGFKSPEPTIAELRADIAVKKIELAELEKTLTEREEKAKLSGEG